MKILFVNNYFYLRGGAEKVFFDEMSLMREKGHKVAAFSVRDENNFKSEYYAYFPEGINYRELDIIKGFNYLPKFLYYIEAKKKFYDLVNVFRPDIIHLHNIYGRITTSVIDVAKENNIPTVMSAHDYKLICPTYLMLNKNKPCEKCLGNKYFYCLFENCHKDGLLATLAYTIESYFNFIFEKYNFIKYIICPSKFILKKLFIAGYDKKKLIFIPNFVNFDEIEPVYEPGNYILYFGRLSIEKGIENLIMAMEKLSISLKIVGSGPLKQKLENYLAENRIKNIEILGHKSGKELRDLIRYSAFVVIPSIWYENAPLSILEAFCLGKPVIASRIGGIPEMVIDGETGFLVEPGNIKELRNKIYFLYRNKEEIIEMGKKARKMIEEKYSPQYHYDLLLDLYKRAVL